jgi:hypothetical protein
MMPMGYEGSAAPVLSSWRRENHAFHAGCSALNAGENSEFPCRFVERHKTGADELTLRTI